MGAYMRRGRPDFKTVLDYFPWLDARRNQQAGTLSGGEQQMLALARAFLQRPRLLMLDEPSLGLAPLVTREVFRVVGDLNQKEGLAVLVVEQNAAIALAAAQRAYVLETGSLALSGTAAELQGERLDPRPRTSATDAAVPPDARLAGSRTARSTARSRWRSC